MYDVNSFFEEVDSDEEDINEVVQDVENEEEEEVITESDDEDESYDEDEDDYEGDENEDDLDADDESKLEEFAMALVQLGDSEGSLNEAKNIVRLNRQTRLLNMTNRTALVMARRSNDTLYKKYSKFNALRLRYRAQIVKKYGSRATSYARKLMSSATKK